MILFCSIFLISKLFRENLFKECGEIVDVRLHTDAEGRFRGFGHVEFATAEAAQKVSCDLVWFVQIVLELPKAFQG